MELILQENWSPEKESNWPKVTQETSNSTWDSLSFLNHFSVSVTSPLPSSPPFPSPHSEPVRGHYMPAQTHGVSQALLRVFPRGGDVPGRRSGQGLPGPGPLHGSEQCLHE